MYQGLNFANSSQKSLPFALCQASLKASTGTSRLPVDILLFTIFTMITNNIPCSFESFCVVLFYVYTLRI